MVTKDLGMVTAYAYAVAGGYTGTEAEFTQLMADLAVVVDDFDNFSVNVTTLPAGSSATASYADGVLSLGIPKGDKGDKGNTGETGAPAGFGTVSATVDDNIGTPSVEVTASGADTAKNFAFAFHNLKGQKGDKGDTGEVSEAELAEALEDFAENGTVANAEQLTTKIRANDQTPYLFRTAGGSVDIGDREYVDAITGGTVAWNQLVQNGNFADTTKWSKASGTLTVANNIGTYTATSAGQYHGIYQSIDVKNGHKYFVNMGYKVTTTSSSATRLRVVFSNGGNGDVTWIDNGSGWQNASYIKAMTGDWSHMYIITEYTLTINIGDTIDYKNIQLIDLTQMFGSTIADYIYSLETANAGAGVAFFRKLFPKPYYAYNAGELLSVSGVSSHDMAGFNQWDEETLVGYYDRSNGNYVFSAGQLCCKNLIPVLPNTVYYFAKTTGTGNSEILYYGSDEQYLNNSKYHNVVNNTFTTPADCHYISVNLWNNYGATYNHDICINLSWDGERDGEYEPYVKHSYPLDDSLTLRGIPKISNGSLYYDGDTYESDGTVTRRYGIVDLGTLDWYYYTEYQMFYLRYAIADKKAGVTNLICSKYPTCEGVWNVERDKICGGNGSNGTVYIRDTSLGTDPSAFKTAMSGVYLVYELATPTTETADAYVGTQIVNDFGTEEFVISNTVDVPIPVGHNTDYPINLKAKVEMAPDSPSGGNGDYIVRQTNGTNEYVALANNATIQNILARLEALEG